MDVAAENIPEDGSYQSQYEMEIEVLKSYWIEPIKTNKNLGRSTIDAKKKYEGFKLKTWRNVTRIFY